MTRSPAPAEPGEYLRNALTHAACEGPVFRRIAAGIRDGIRNGQLRPGDRLPPHRALATTLNVAVPTVSRAYREAQREGLISSTVGRGTFIAGLPTLHSAASATFTSKDTPLDLSINGPARGPHEPLLRDATARLARDPHLADMLGYAADIGAANDRAAAAAWLALSGIAADPERIVMCQGGQHAILVALGALLRPGDVLLTEAVTYPGVKSAASVLGVTVRGVEMDDAGILPEALERACVTADPRPRAVYLMPTAHNPTAVTLSEERRRAIVDIARRHDLFIIEDDVFGLLAAPGSAPIPIAVRAPEQTLYLSSLSKTISPGLRWGIVLAPPPLVDRLGALIRATVFNPAPIAAAVATNWIADGTAKSLLQWQRDEMAERFKLARNQLGPTGSVNNIRSAGLHTWLDLAGGWTAAELVRRAAQVGVEVCPTEYFTADAEPVARMDTAGVRLCLGNAPDRDALAAGLSRLRDILEQPADHGTQVRI